ncbi:MAG: NADPH-dependent 7-cyano-7-deazaguanine reductase QueF [Deltaproteobacteria bacterium]|nr:NADPH-dependent 7-cyano-7-deazaguanine reductase QueF [Deltaproteobacteria bacterium]
MPFAPSTLFLPTPFSAESTREAERQRLSFCAKAMSTTPSKNLETFPNPRPGRRYEIAFECPEFTCVCPMTGQPDFATIRIRYTPNARCVELKSLKLYLWSYRQEGHFHEAVTNQILDDLVASLDPIAIKVTGDFWVRGGIHTVVEAGHERG